MVKITTICFLNGPTPRVLVEILSGLNYPILHTNITPVFRLRFQLSDTSTADNDYNSLTYLLRVVLITLPLLHMAITTFSPVLQFFLPCDLGQRHPSMKQFLDLAHADGGEQDLLLSNAPSCQRSSVALHPSPS